MKNLVQANGILKNKMLDVGPCNSLCSLNLISTCLKKDANYKMQFRLQCTKIWWMFSLRNMKKSVPRNGKSKLLYACKGRILWGAGTNARIKITNTCICRYIFKFLVYLKNAKLFNCNCILLLRKNYMRYFLYAMERTILR